MVSNSEQILADTVLFSSFDFFSFFFAVGETIKWATGMEEDWIVDLSEFAGGGLGSVGGWFTGRKVGGWIGKGVMRLSSFTMEDSPQTMLQSCYAFLGASPSSSDHDIKMSYRKLSLKLHPDKGGSEEDMTKLNVCKELIFLSRK